MSNNESHPNPVYLWRCSTIITIWEASVYLKIHNSSKVRLFFLTLWYWRWDLDLRAYYMHLPNGVEAIIVLAQIADRGVKVDSWSWGEDQSMYSHCIDNDHWGSFVKIKESDSVIYNLPRSMTQVIRIFIQKKHISFKSLLRLHT